MKVIKKILAVVAAAVLSLAIAIPAMAATGTDSGQGGEATIKVTLPDIPEGYTAENVYTIYQIFNAVPGDDGKITYTLSGSHTTVPDFSGISGSPVFYLDSVGNVRYGTWSTATPPEFIDNDDANLELSAEQIAVLKAYVTDDDIVATVNTTIEDKDFTVTGLKYGYYFIDTTTGTFVTIDSTNPNAEVIDKNTVPFVDKLISGATSYDEDGKKALAQVGTDVEFTGIVTIGKGVVNYVFHDTMDDTLAYTAGGIKVYSDADKTQEVSSDYWTETAGATGETFAVEFDNEYMASLTAGDKLYVVYKATVTSDALQDDPAHNTASLSYGNEDGTNSTPVIDVVVYNAKFTIVKTDGDGAALEGAGFVLSRVNDSTTEYYKIADSVVSWVTSIDDATEVITAKGSGDEATAEFTGLANGTYTLIENTVPKGYNKAADFEFTVVEHDYTAENLKQDATVVNQQGTELPSTGGIGTTIFYVIGAILVIGAGVVLVTRRRMHAE